MTQELVKNERTLCIVAAAVVEQVEPVEAVVGKQRVADAVLGIVAVAVAVVEHIEPGLVVVGVEYGAVEGVVEGIDLLGIDDPPFFKGDTKESYNFPYKLDISGPGKFKFLDNFLRNLKLNQNRNLMTRTVFLF